MDLHDRRRGVGRPSPELPKTEHREAREEKSGQNCCGQSGRFASLRPAEPVHGVAPEAVGVGDVPEAVGVGDGSDARSVDAVGYPTINHRPPTDWKRKLARLVRLTDRPSLRSPRAMKRTSAAAISAPPLAFTRIRIESEASVTESRARVGT
jgi:hypothetical protein